MLYAPPDFVNQAKIISKGWEKTIFINRGQAAYFHKGKYTYSMEVK